MFGQSELILVDNASSDNSEELGRQLTTGWPNVQIIQTGRNLGFSGNNKGAEIARGKYLYLLNPDTWLEPDCLELFYEAVERDGAQGAGGTILEYDDNSLQARGSSGFDIFGNPVSPPLKRDPNPLFCIAGFYFINRTFFLELGMLDEKFFMYGEEMDLSWRIWLSGGRIIFVPKAKCHHRGAVAVNPEGGTKIVENRTSPQKRFLANRNFLLVIAKNCEHILLLMLVSCTALMLAEGLVTLLLTRKWQVTRQTCLEPLADFWRLRTHVRQERRRIRALRRHNDFWMLRFLRFGFGRWGEVSKILRIGFPTFGR
jgi:GT2 family glycosyltransferase